MASNSVTLNSDINQCSICLEEFTQPKFLDCHHTFCMECIRDLNQTSPGTVCCPLCQRQVQLPAGGVEQLTSNFYIMNINTNNNCNCNNTSNNSITTNNRITTNSLGNTDKKCKDELKICESDKIDNIKTIHIDYNSYKDTKFDGVMFNFYLGLYKSDKWGDTLGVQLKISTSSSPFVKSCDIDYDISLVNQKDREYSVRQTGSRNLVPEGNSDPIHLLKLSDALNEDNCFYYKKVELSGQFRTTRKIFQLGVGINVKNKKMKNFNLI